MIGDNRTAISDMLLGRDVLMQSTMTVSGGGEVELTKQVRSTYNEGGMAHADEQFPGSDDLSSGRTTNSSSVLAPAQQPSRDFGSVSVPVQSSANNSSVLAPAQWTGEWEFTGNDIEQIVSDISTIELYHISDREVRENVLDLVRRYKPAKIKESLVTLKINLMCSQSPFTRLAPLG